MRIPECRSIPGVRKKRVPLANLLAPLRGAEASVLQQHSGFANLLNGNYSARFDKSDQCSIRNAQFSSEETEAGTKSEVCVPSDEHWELRIGAPSEAWRFWQGESPCGVRPNQPLLPSVAAAT